MYALSVQLAFNPLLAACLLWVAGWTMADPAIVDLNDPAPDAYQPQIYTSPSGETLPYRLMAPKDLEPDKLFSQHKQ